MRILARIPPTDRGVEPSVRPAQAAASTTAHPHEIDLRMWEWTNSICTEWENIVRVNRASHPPGEARSPPELMTEYTPRVVEGEIDELMSGLAAVALEGSKGVGKKTTAERRAQTVHRLPPRCSHVSFSHTIEATNC